MGLDVGKIVGVGVGAVDELADHFLQDTDVSEEIDPEAWKRRPLASRAKELTAELGRHSF